MSATSKIAPSAMEVTTSMVEVDMRFRKVGVDTGFSVQATTVRARDGARVAAVRTIVRVVSTWVVAQLLILKTAASDPGSCWITRVIAITQTGCGTIENGSVMVKG